MYSEIASLKTNFLSVIRKGWFRRTFELTDGNESYGQISYPGFFKRKASVKTASGFWIFHHKNFFSRTILITNANGLTIAKLDRYWFSSNALLQLENGTIYKFSRLSFWNRKFEWADDQQKQLLTFKGRLFSKIFLDITLDKNTRPDSLLLLLCFLGTHLILLKRRRKAAAAH